jgi:hypothetical protein
VAEIIFGRRLCAEATACLSRANASCRSLLWGETCDSLVPFIAGRACIGTGLDAVPADWYLACAWVVIPGSVCGCFSKRFYQSENCTGASPPSASPPTRRYTRYRRSDGRASCEGCPSAARQLRHPVRRTIGVDDANPQAAPTHTASLWLGAISPIGCYVPDGFSHFPPCPESKAKGRRAQGSRQGPR